MNVLSFGDESSVTYIEARVSTTNELRALHAPRPAVIDHLAILHEVGLSCT